MRSLSDPHNDALYRCPSCQNGWTVPPDTPLGSFDDEVKKFMRTLEKMRTAVEWASFVWEWPLVPQR